MRRDISQPNREKIIKKDKMLTQTFFSSCLLCYYLEQSTKTSLVPGHPSFLSLPLHLTCMNPSLFSLLLFFFFYPSPPWSLSAFLSGSFMSVFRVTLFPSFTFLTACYNASRHGTHLLTSPHLSPCLFPTFYPWLFIFFLFVFSAAGAAS